MRPAHALLALLLLPVLLIVGFVTIQPVQVVPRGDAAPPFVLVGPDGVEVSNAALYGQPYVVAVRAVVDGEDAVGAAMAAVEASLQAAGLDDAVARIEVPLGAPPPSPVPNWRHLAGPPEVVRQVVGGGYGLLYATDADGRVTRYEPRLILIDGHGLLRSFHPPGPAGETVARDLALVLEEAGSTGVRRALFEGAHLFMCYR